MTADADLQTLKDLEANYWETPAFAQAAELRDINDLRVRLGLPQVDAKLRVPAAVPAGPKPKAKPDHSEAKAVYDRYLARLAELNPHREYATRLCKATEGSGMTAVRPLATMGTNGGELLCDHCGKPIILEGGWQHKKTAGEAYARQPGDWKSYILGGVVFEITLNGTVRVYHGHLGMIEKECSTQGYRAIEAADAAHVRNIPEGLPNRLYDYLRAEHPQMKETEVSRIVGEVLNVLFSYDPGIGCNRPD